MCDILIDIFTVGICRMVQPSFRDGGHSAIVHQSDPTLNLKNFKDYCRESHAYARGCRPSFRFKFLIFCKTETETAKPKAYVLTHSV